MDRVQNRFTLWPYSELDFAILTGLGWFSRAEGAHELERQSVEHANGTSSVAIPAAPSGTPDRRGHVPSPVASPLASDADSPVRARAFSNGAASASAITHSIPAGDVAAPTTETAVVRPSIAAVLWTYFVCGAIPTGGKPLALMLPEMAERRHWLTPRHFSEAIAFGYALPGPVLVSMIVYLTPLIPGQVPTLLCLAVFLLPGVATLIGMTVFMLDSSRPAWADGAIRGLGPAAVGMLVGAAWPVFHTTRSARQGLLIAALAFVGVGLLKLDLLLVLSTLGLLSLVLNRPRRQSDVR